MAGKARGHRFVDGLRPESTMADVKAAELRVRQLRWLAGKMDPEAIRDRGASRTPRRTRS